MSRLNSENCCFHLVHNLLPFRILYTDVQLYEIIILFVLLYGKNRDISACIATVGMQFPAEARNFSLLHSFQIGGRGQPSLLSSGHQFLFLRE
jgi:hypothetical protein